MGTIISSIPPIGGYYRAEEPWHGEVTCRRGRRGWFLYTQGARGLGEDWLLSILPRSQTSFAATYLLIKEESTIKGSPSTHWILLGDISSLDLLELLVKPSTRETEVRDTTYVYCRLDYYTPIAERKFTSRHGIPQLKTAWSSTRKCKKYLFSEKELIRFNIAVWTPIDSVFIYLRNKAWVSFNIAIFCETGGHIGAFSSD